jgi:hypothetical protein
MEPPARPCLVCGRPEDDPLHGPERGGLAHDITSRIEQHAYDPGERRHLVRRMDDRIHKIEDAVRRRA